MIDDTTDPDPRTLERQLVDASIVTGTGDDLRLTEEFRRDWRRRIEHLRDREPVEYVGLLLDADPAELETEDRDGKTVVTRAREEVGQWPSEAAVAADVAAFVTLGEQFPAWENLDGRGRDELVARLRTFLEACPACGGELAAETRAGKSGPSPQVDCEDCGVILL